MSPDQPIRVVIADDHPLVRDGVRESLAERGVDICGEACEAQGAIAAARRERPDVARGCCARRAACN